LGIFDGVWGGVMEYIWDVWRVGEKGIVGACGTDWCCEIWQEFLIC
jgi:hypothetical protein